MIVYTALLGLFSFVTAIAEVRPNNYGPGDHVFTISLRNALNIESSEGEKLLGIKGKNFVVSDTPQYFVYNSEKEVQTIDHLCLIITKDLNVEVSAVCPTNFKMFRLSTFGNTLTYGNSETNERYYWCPGDILSTFECSGGVNTALWTTVKSEEESKKIISEYKRADPLTEPAGGWSQPISPDEQLNENFVREKKLHEHPLSPLESISLTITEQPIIFKTESYPEATSGTHAGQKQPDAGQKQPDDGQKQPDDDKKQPDDGKQSASNTVSGSPITPGSANTSGSQTASITVSGSPITPGSANTSGSQTVSETVSGSPITPGSANNSGTASASTSPGDGSSGPKSTTTHKTTTIITVTSCSKDVCHQTTVPATMGPTTVTVGGTTTIYTTWCPVTAEETGHTSSMTDATKTQVSEKVTGTNLATPTTLVSTASSSGPQIVAPTISPVFNGAGKLAASLVIFGIPFAWLL